MADVHEEAKVEAQRAELLRRVPAFAAKVAPIYRLLLWTWGTREAPLVSEIPDAEKLESSLRGLIACDPFKIGCWSASGGFRVGVDEEGTAYMRLEIEERVYDL